jgi:hypothetical protein
VSDDRIDDGSDQGRPPAMPPEAEPGPPALAVPPPQPMDLGQMVDAVIGLYRQRPGLLLGLCAVLQIPAAIIGGLLLLPVPGLMRDMLGFDPFVPTLTTMPTSLPTPTDEQLLGVLWPVSLATLVTTIASALTTTAVAVAVRQLRISAAASIGGAYGVVLRRLLAALGGLAASTIALSGLLVLGVAGFALLLGLAPGATGGGPLAFAAVLLLVAVIVLAVFISIRWTFWPQAVVLDGAGPLGSLGRSWRIIAGATWRVLGYVLLFGLAAGILSGLLAQLGLIVVDTVAPLLPEPVEVGLTFTVSVVTSLLLAPIVPVAMTLLYLDLRIRRGERLDAAPPIGSPG